MFRLVAMIALISGGAATLLAQSPAILRWAGDAEGGAPYVEADPSDPSRVVGFDVEVAELIAKGLGRGSSRSARAARGAHSASAPAPSNEARPRARNLRERVIDEVMESPWTSKVIRP